MLEIFTHAGSLVQLGQGCQVSAVVEEFGGNLLIELNYLCIFNNNNFILIINCNYITLL